MDKVFSLMVGVLGVFYPVILGAVVALQQIFLLFLAPIQANTN